MILRPSLTVLLACALAGCGGNAVPAPDPGNWPALLAAHDGVGAKAALRRELDRGTPPAVLAPYLAEAELQQGNLSEAERWLTGGSFAPGVAAHGFQMLGRLRMQQGDLPAAGQAFDKALATNADNPGLWADIGQLRWRGGEQAQAIDAGERALLDGPENPDALLFRAQLMRDSNGNAAALALIERALVASPYDPDLLAEQAATLGELGRTQEMLAATRKLALAAPNDRRALYLQAVLAARSGRYDLARNLLQRIGDRDRVGGATTLLLAIVDMENGNFASAAQGFDQLARRQPDNLRVKLLLARALALGGNYRELIARFGGDADTPYLALLVGRAHEALGERDKAAPYLDAARTGGALKIIPVAPVTELAVAELRGAADGANVVGIVRGLIARGRTGEARAAAGAFLARHPGSADALALAGDAALAARDARGAAEFYARSGRIRRTWSLVQRTAFALDRSGRRERATSLIAAQLAGEPANADAAAVLARRLLDRGDDDRAAHLLDYARARGRNDPVLERLIEG